MAVSRSVALLLACCAVATTVLAVVELWQGRDAAQLALQRLQAQAAETDPASQRVRSVDLVDSPAADAVVGSLEPGGAVVKVAVTQLVRCSQLKKRVNAVGTLARKKNGKKNIQNCPSRAM